MNRFETFILGAIVVLVAWASVLLLDGPDVPKPEPVPNTDANVGKCIQGHRVLWHESRAQAAEACLASLGEVGEQAFSQTWHNFETQLEHW